MLIDQHRISVGVDRHEERRPLGAGIGLDHELHALLLELALQFAHVFSNMPWNRPMV